MILRSSARGIAHESAIAVLLVGTCLVSLAPPSAFAQQSELDSLAAKLSKAISEVHGKRVIVLDFTTTEGKSAELGHLVSDDFSDALAKNPGGFELIRPLQTKEAPLPIQGFPSGLLSKDFVKQAGKHADADIVVYGYLFPQEDSILIDVESLQVDQDKQLWEFHGRLPVAPEREPLLEILRNESSPFPPAGRFGFGIPKCVYCPRPDYTDEAIKSHAEGVLVLQVVITPEGRASDVKVLKAVGFGFDQRAIETVKKWKFQPARGPDGAPIAVLTLIEVTFHWLK